MHVLGIVCSRIRIRSTLSPSAVCLEQEAVAANNKVYKSRGMLGTDSSSCKWCSKKKLDHNGTLFHCDPAASPVRAHVLLVSITAFASTRMEGRGGVAGLALQHQPGPRGHTEGTEVPAARKRRV